MKSVLGLLGFLTATFGAAAFGGYATASSVNTWYPTLRKPAWRPPDSAFGPVWTVLYVLMAIAAWLVWRAEPAGETAQDTRRAALAAWGVQLSLNAMWSAVFFGGRSIGGGLAVIAALLSAVVACLTLSARVSKPAGVLFVPYLAWTAFASALNARIWQLNRL